MSVTGKNFQLQRIGYQIEVLRLVVQLPGQIYSVLQPAPPTQVH